MMLVLKQRMMLKNCLGSSRLAKLLVCAIPYKPPLPQNYKGNWRPFKYRMESKLKKSCYAIEAKASPLQQLLEIAVHILIADQYRGPVMKYACNWMVERPTSQGKVLGLIPSMSNFRHGIRARDWVWLAVTRRPKPKCGLKGGVRDSKLHLDIELARVLDMKGTCISVR